MDGISNLVTDNNKGTTKLILREDPDEPYTETMEIIVVTPDHERNRWGDGPRRPAKVMGRLNSKDDEEFAVREITFENNEADLKINMNRAMKTPPIRKVEIRGKKGGKKEVQVDGKDAFVMDHNEELAAIVDFPHGGM